jgi:hypothetical protein
MRERTAAWAPNEEICQFTKETAMAGAAVAAVAHSRREKSQEEVCGATLRIEAAVKRFSISALGSLGEVLSRPKMRVSLVGAPEMRVARARMTVEVQVDRRGILKVKFVGLLK